MTNLAAVSKHWNSRGVRLEGLTEFATSIQPGDRCLGMDLEKGYRHMRLHPSMRDWFIFRYRGRYFRSIALPFGWSRSPFWFCSLTAVFTQTLREWGYRVLPYVDDFLILPSPHGVISTRAHCRDASRRVDELLNQLGMSRNADKSCWGDGSQRIDHLGVTVDTVTMRFQVTTRKAQRVRDHARSLLRQVAVGRRMVSTDSVRSFCGVCVALSLAMPWARFYTRSLYTDLARSTSRRRHRDSARRRTRLSHQSVRDLRFWRRLARSDLAGRPIAVVPLDASVHTDAAGLGYGATLNFNDLSPGVPGMYSTQGVWSWRERAKAITHRELRAIRLSLSRSLGYEIVNRRKKHVVLHVDNQVVVHVVISFVSASLQMMDELRRLKRLLDALGLTVRAEWIPSVVNRWADSLSRRLSIDALKILPQLRRSIKAGMRAPVDAFQFRPLGEPSFMQRRLALAEMDREWTKTETLMLCPPPDLIQPCLDKLRMTRAPAVMLIPDWPRQPWHAPATRMATVAERLPLPAGRVWTSTRRINPAWKLLMLHINLPR